MIMRSRFFLVLVLLSGIGLTIPLHGNAAILTANDWQKQLQGEIQGLASHTPSMTVQGNVSVSEKGGQWVATLPAMTIAASDSARFKVPSIILYADNTTGQAGNVRIQLPETIPYHDATGRERGNVKIATQNISGKWNYSGSYFENLSGTLENVVYYDEIGRSQSTISQIVLNAVDPRTPQMTANKIQNIVQNQGAVIRSSVQSTTLRYEFAPNSKMTLIRVVGLLNPVWLLADHQPMTINVAAEGIVHTDRLAQVTYVKSVTSRLQVLPREDDNALLGGRMNVVIQDVKQQPESYYSFILPQKLSLLGTLNNMPVQILSQPFNVVQGLMVEAGTRADISEIIWDTNSKTRLTGTGWMRAAAGVPLGMVGRLSLTIEDLRAMNAALQKQLAVPGTDIKVKTQGYMLLMLLQSFAKEGSETSEIVLDFTADGQVLVNNQDISALLSRVSGLRSPR